MDAETGDQESCELQLLDLQMQTADMKSQLDMLLKAIESFESATASATATQMFQAPGNDHEALRIWQAAGLAESATFADIAVAVEEWAFQNAGNMQAVLEKGWLTFLYSLIEDTVCRLPGQN